MKKLSLLALLVLTVSVSTSINANEANLDESAVADTSKANQGTNQALRLKFISRRAYQNPAVKNKKQYNADDAWVGTSYADERESKASKRLNRQFRSKRPYTNYQFD